jgi:hypothetical protein
MTTATTRNSDRRISPVFVGILAVTAVTGWATWTGFAAQPGVAVFLFVTAAVAVVMGLVGLVAGRMPRTTGRRQEPHAAVTSWSPGADAGSRTRTGAEIFPASSPYPKGRSAMKRGSLEVVS